MSGRILTGRMRFVYRKPLSQNTFHKKALAGMGTGVGVD